MAFAASTATALGSPAFLSYRPSSLAGKFSARTPSCALLQRDGLTLCASMARNSRQLVSAGIPCHLIAARRVCVFAAEGSQTAKPEAAVAEPVPAVPSSNQSRSTFDIIRDVIVEQLAVEASKVSPETKFVDLGADSLDTVEIIMSLEEKFGVNIEEDGTEKISTVKDAADLIEQKMAK